MAECDKFRHELKYICTEAQLFLVQSKISCLMSLDSHVSEKSSYNVRSLYFDDYSDTCYYEKINGTDPREKFRIRIYNCDDRYIRLELKKKERGKTLKQSCPLTKEQFDYLTMGEAPALSADAHPLVRKLCLSITTRLMRPKIIVDYERTPYILKSGNVRFTLDQNISSSSATDNFLNKIIDKRSVMPQGHSILEVKYDEFLPSYLYNASQIENLQATALSKYCLCRKYSLKGCGL